MTPNYDKTAPLDYINNVLHDHVGLPVRLLRDDGYHYVIWDDEDAGIFMESTVMVPYTSDYTLGQWVKEAELIYAEMRAEADEISGMVNGQFGVGA